jgi:hypothetical protein
LSEHPQCQVRIEPDFLATNRGICLTAFEF